MLITVPCRVFSMYRIGNVTRCQMLIRRLSGTEIQIIKEPAATIPGFMIPTRTPLAAHSSRNDCAKPRSPNLLAQ